MGDGDFYYFLGIIIDLFGYIFVFDCINWVQVFNLYLCFVIKFGGKLSGDGQLSGLFGIDYILEGWVVVVDVGNNFVKVFYFFNEQRKKRKLRKKNLLMYIGISIKLV